MWHKTLKNTLVCALSEFYLTWRDEPGFGLGLASFWTCESRSFQAWVRSGSRLTFWKLNYLGVQIQVEPRVHSWHALIGDNMSCLFCNSPDSMPYWSKLCLWLFHDYLYKFFMQQLLLMSHHVWSAILFLMSNIVVQGTVTHWRHAKIFWDTKVTEYVGTMPYFVINLWGKKLTKISPLKTFLETKKLRKYFSFQWFFEPGNW